MGGGPIVGVFIGVLVIVGVLVGMLLVGVSVGVLVIVGVLVAVGVMGGPPCQMAKLCESLAPAMVNWPPTFRSVLVIPMPYTGPSVPLPTGAQVLPSQAAM